MNKVKNILYIGKLVYTKDGQEFEDLHSDKKIGITSDLDSRAQALTGTNSPFVWVPIRAWRRRGMLDASSMERALHNLKREERIAGLTAGKKSEWFSDDGDHLVTDVSYLLDNHPEWDSLKDLEETRDELVKKVGKRQATESYSEEQYLSILEGMTLTGKAYGFEIQTDVGMNDANSFIIGDEDNVYIDSNPVVSTGAAIREAHRRSGSTAYCASNFKKYMYEVNTGKSVGQIMAEAYSE